MHDRSIIAVIFTVIALNASVEYVSAKRRIRDGALAAIKNYPYHAIMMYMNTWHCGGSIISVNHILTAAHCVTENGTRISSTEFSFKYGTNVNNDASGKTVQVKDMRPHDGFDTVNYESDIAIAILETPIELSAVAKIAKLGKKRPVVGQNVILTGHGATEFGLEETKLRTTTVPIIDLNECKMHFLSKISEKNMACMLHATRRFCYGDSGGPIVEYKSYPASYVQVGVISFGQGYGNTTTSCPPMLGPDVMTIVASYKTWINSVTGNAATWVDN